ATFFLSSYSVLVASLYLYVFSDNKQLHFMLALKILFLSSIVMEIITILSIVYNFDPLLYIKTHELKPPMNSYHLREIFTSAMMPFILYLYYQKPTNIKAVLIIISLIGILASTSRTAILATVISLSLFVFIKNHFKVFSKDSLLFLLAITVSLSISFYVSPQIQERVESFQTTFTEKGDQMSGRFDVYEKSFELFLQSPYMGNGIKSAGFLSQSDQFLDIAKHPHNIWLEILMDTGLVGMSGFLLFILFFLKELYTGLSTSYLIKGTMVATLASIFLSSLSSWSIWSGNHIGSIMIILILVYSVKDRNDSVQLR
ncbi:MAG: O-antigen ligase family protein, partial [Sulfurospirillaceae bacterium]|nr:O-antigen ligase family protein [Sulfurospirillaceae bacterium]